MKNSKILLNGAVFFAFLASLIYWIYLVLNSRMIIECDAAHYASLGRMLADKGLWEYLSAGPTREPLYPLLISLSISIGKIFGISYQQIQIILQFLILFITQLMLVYILCLLKIHKLIAASIILYFCISPAIINSALSLYSEIITYPLILAAVLIIRQSWLSFLGSKRQIMSFAVITGLLFVLITLTKGIFEIITPVFIVLFSLTALLTHSRRSALNVLMYVVVVLSIFYGLVSGYKLANKAINGNFTVTNRGGVIFYASVARRTAPFTFERFLTALACVPGEGVCRGVFGEGKCYYWSFQNSDAVGYKKFFLIKGTDKSYGEADAEIVRIAFKEIIQEPAKFLLFSCLEWLKIFFWESTQMGFVSYPQGLARLFSCAPLKNGLRLSVSFLTSAAFICTVIFLLRRRREFFLIQENNEILIFFSILFVVLFSGFSSLCQILPRFILPMVPLYLVILAFVLQKIFFKPG